MRTNLRRYILSWSCLYKILLVHIELQSQFPHGKGYYAEITFDFHFSSVFQSKLEFRCYFCDEIKIETPFFFELWSQKKEPVCKRCNEKKEIVRRLKEGSGEQKWPIVWEILISQLASPVFRVSCKTIPRREHRTLPPISWISQAPVSSFSRNRFSLESTICFRLWRQTHLRVHETLRSDCKPIPLAWDGASPDILYFFPECSLSSGDAPVRALVIHHLPLRKPVEAGTLLRRPVSLPKSTQTCRYYPCPVQTFPLERKPPLSSKQPYSLSTWTYRRLLTREC